MMIFWLKWLTVASLLAVTAMPAVAISDTQFEKLQLQLNELAQRVQSLETDNARLRGLLKDKEEQKTLAVKAEQTTKETAVVPTNITKDNHWSDRISISGDFRYRYEDIDIEGRKRRDRNRIRARATLLAQVSNNVTAGLGISTGGDAPVSANQTLGGGGDRKEIRLSLAYARWQALEGLSFNAGKMPNAFYRPQKSGLLWDGDYHPEGVSGRWSNDHLFVIAAANWLESDSNQSNQQIAWGVQVGTTWDFAWANLTTGGGYFDIPVAGEETFFGDADDFYGNSYLCNDYESATGCRYRYDYEEAEWFFDLRMRPEGWQWPLSIYADVVKNLAVDDFDTGYQAGIRLGDIGKGSSWQLGYEYQNVEADAVFGLLSDSDFAIGGSDTKGHRLFSQYAINSKVRIGLTWYLKNKYGEDSLEKPFDYDRIVLDADFVY